MKLESHLPKHSFWLYMGPVLNVLLILMIFVFLGGNLVIKSGVQVQPPPSASKLVGFDQAQLLTLTAADTGMMYFNGELVQFEQYRAKLHSHEHGPRKLVIHADEMAAFGKVQQAANLALSLGFEVGYATQPHR